jgi:hypothetical protein
MQGFLARKRTLPQEKQDSMEAEIAELIRDLHHRFYRIKMKVILTSKSDAPFEELRKLMKSDKVRAPVLGCRGVLQVVCCACAVCFLLLLLLLLACCAVSEKEGGKTPTWIRLASLH